MLIDVRNEQVGRSYQVYNDWADTRKYGHAQYADGQGDPAMGKGSLQVPHGDL